MLGLLAGDRQRNRGLFLKLGSIVTKKHSNWVFGVSEYVVNHGRGEIFLRGFASGKRGALDVLLAFADGETVQPVRTRIKRPDVQDKQDQLGSLECGFEFLLPIGQKADGFPTHLLILDDSAHGALEDKAARTHAIKLRQPDINNIEAGITFLEANAMSQHIVMHATLQSAASFEFAGITLDGSPLVIEQTRFEELAGEKTKSVVRARLATEFRGERYQVFPAAGSRIEATWKPASSTYRVHASTNVEQGQVRQAIGAILGARLDKARRLLEIRGTFLGRFNKVRVKVSVDGEDLPRAARIETSPQRIPITLAHQLDSPLTEWLWCGEFAKEIKGSATIAATLVDGTRIIDRVESRFKKDQFEIAEGVLEPTFFVSPHQAEFDRMVQLAAPANEATVMMVFPGDLFATFGGGPSRVIQVASYLRSMGLKVVLVDRPKSGSSIDLPENMQAIFEKRMGIGEEVAEEFVHLALDFLTREPGAETAIPALEQSLEHRDTPPDADVIIRRQRPQFDALVAFFAALVQPDFLIANFAWTASIFDHVSPTTCRILDTHDIQFMRGKMHFAETGDGSLIADLQNEVQHWLKADYVLAIQNEEKDFIIAESKRNNVILCGHARNATAFSGDAKTKTVLFVGNRYLPNIRGMQNFIDTCWAAIKKQVPDARLVIAGAVCEDLQTDLPDVELLGVVDDLDALYRRSAVVINPVEFGTGLNIKTVEALCAGACLVTTAHGVRGVDPPEDAAIVLDLRDFADAVSKVLKDRKLQTSLRKGAHQFALKSLVPEHVFRELFNTMELRLYV